MWSTVKTIGQYFSARWTGDMALPYTCTSIYDAWRPGQCDRLPGQEVQAAYPWLSQTLQVALHSGS